MTLSEFVREYREAIRPDGTLTPGRCGCGLRFHSPGGRCHCPITAVCLVMGRGNFHTREFENAANLLGLAPHTRKAIACAADAPGADWLRRATYRAVRRALDGAAA